MKSVLNYLALYFETVPEKLRKVRLLAWLFFIGITWTDGIMGKEAEINKALGVEEKKLLCVLPIGYPDEVPRVPPRKEGKVTWLGS